MAAAFGAASNGAGDSSLQSIATNGNQAVQQLGKLIEAIGDIQFPQPDDFSLTILSRIITPRQFGAVGDGVTDDTEAVQDAFDADADAVWLPEDDNYLITDTITLSSKKIIQGTAQASTLTFVQGAGTTAKNAIRVADGAAGSTLAGFRIDYDAGGSVVTGGAIIEGVAAASNCTLSQLDIDGNKASQVVVIQGIDFGASNTKIIDCSIADVTGYGIAANRCSNTYIARNIISNWGNAYYAIVQNHSSSGQRYQNNYVIDNICDGSGATTSHDQIGIFVYGDATFLVSNVQVRGNTHTGVAGALHSIPAGIVIFYGTGTVIEGNTTKYAGIGISLGDCDLVSVTGNTVLGPSYYGIELGGGGRLTATGNTVDGETRTLYGIVAQAAANMGQVTVVGNTLYRIATNGVRGHLSAGALRQMVVCSNNINLTTGATAGVVLESGVTYGVVNGNLIDSLGTFTNAVQALNLSGLVVTSNLSIGHSGTMIVTTGSINVTNANNQAA